MTHKDEIFVCQKNFSHVWGEMPFIQKCCECSGELIPYLPSSSVKELVTLLERGLELFRNMRRPYTIEGLGSPADQWEFEVKEKLKQFEEKND